MADNVDARLATLGITLPDAPNPVANYVPSCLSGNLLFISGQVSKAADGSIVSGQLGGGMTVAEGRAAARLCALNILAQAKAALGSLDRVAQIVRLNGFVNAAPEFTEHPQVMNGASDLMVEVLGDTGRHTRVAVGVVEPAARLRRRGRRRAADRPLRQAMRDRSAFLKPIAHRGLHDAAKGIIENTVPAFEAAIAAATASNATSARRPARRRWCSTT